MKNKTNPFAELAKIAEEYRGDAELLARSFLASRDMDQVHACNRLVWRQCYKTLDSYLHGSHFVPFTFDGDRCLDNSEIDFDQLQNYAAEFLGE